MQINLNLTFTDKPIVNLTEFGQLMLILDAVNNLGEKILISELFEKKELFPSFNSNTFHPDVQPGFSHIMKNSPTTMTIQFSNTCAFWIIAFLTDHVNGWGINRKSMEKQFQEYLKEISRSEQEKLEIIRDETYRRLSLRENQAIIADLIKHFDINSNKVERISIEVNEYA